MQFLSVWDKLSRVLVCSLETCATNAVESSRMLFLLTLTGETKGYFQLIDVVILRVASSVAGAPQGSEQPQPCPSGMHNQDKEKARIRVPSKSQAKLSPEAVTMTHMNEFIHLTLPSVPGCDSYCKSFPLTAFGLNDLGGSLECRAQKGALESLVCT